MKVIIKGKEAEVEDNEVLKAVQEEYEKKLAAKENDVKVLKEEHEAEKTKIREEHILQIRALLSGRESNPDIPEFEETEKTLEEKTLESAKNYYNKIRGI